VSIAKSYLFHKRHSLAVYISRGYLKPSVNSSRGVQYPLANGKELRQSSGKLGRTIGNPSAAGWPVLYGEFIRAMQ
jgi:hypothetical protein